MDTRQTFGRTPDGDTVETVALYNGGAYARVMSWGASLQDFRIEGVRHALVLGAPNFAPYLTDMRYFGAIVGPVANRIAQGRAPLNGRELELERNENGQTTLHGGEEGCGLRNWRILSHGEAFCTLGITIPDGTGGLPGPISLSARYQLEDDGALLLEITGQTEQLSFCNPAHHSYWNLDGSPDLSHHRLTVRADRYLPVDAQLIPTGAIGDVTNTRFDFRRERHALMGAPEVLDHNFCLSSGPGDLRPVCWLETDDLLLEVSTTEPGLQIYDGSGLDTAPGHHPDGYGARAGLAIEPQHWPDAPNHPEFPSILLRKGETYRQRSRFHVQKKKPG